MWNQVSKSHMDPYMMDSLSSVCLHRPLVNTDSESTAAVFPASIVVFSLFLCFLIAHLFLYPIYSSIFFPSLLEWFPAAIHFQMFLREKKNLILHRNSQPQNDSFYCPGLFTIKRPFHIIHESKLIHPYNLDF